MKHHCVLASLILCCMVSLARPARAASALPVCAFISTVSGENSGIADLLDAKLPQDITARFVERNQIEQVLREQKLESILGADAGQQRAAIGKLLQADLLIILKRAEKSPASIDMVVCETRHGMRLCVQSFAPGKDREQDVTELEGLIRRALRKHAEQITMVCAVPPFISNDLTNEFSYLQRAYAAVIEQSLMQRDGVLVVEFSEAQAIGREIALSNGGDISRRPPVYVLGDFRDEGAGGRKDESVGDQRTVTLHLLAKAGNAVVGERTKSGLAPNATAQFLRDAAGELVFARSGVAQPVTPDAELKQIAERMAELEKLSSWSQAADLAEASLLLKPDQPETERDAVIILSNMVREDLTIPSHKDRFPLALKDYMRGLRHLDRYLHSDVALKDTNVRNNPMADLVYNLHAPDSDATAPVAEARAETHRVIFGFLCRASAMGNNHLGLLLQFVNMEWQGRNFGPLLQQLLDFTRDVPGGRERAKVLITTVIDSPVWRQLPAYDNLLNWLEASPNQEYRVAATELRVERAKTPTPEPIAQFVQRRGLDPSKPSGVVIEPVGDCIIRDLQGRVEKGTTNPVAFMPAGKGIDVAFDSRGAFVMKKKGEVDHVLALQEGFRPFDPPCFDGKYVWVRMRREKPTVLMLDPVSEKSWYISAGLPPITESAYIAPLAPGRVCIVATAERTWAAIVVHKPPNHVTIDVFYEARERDDNTPDLWKSSDVAFFPMFAYTLTEHRTDGKQPEQRVVIGRGSSRNQGLLRRPLLVDPDRKTVEVFSEELLQRAGGRMTAYDGALYWSGELPSAPHLYRLGFPTLRVEKLQDNPPDGDIVISQGHIFICQSDNFRAFWQHKEIRNPYWPKQWWVTESFDKPFRPLWPVLPDDREVRDVHLRNTENYGLLANGTPEVRTIPPNYSVQLVKPPSGAR